MVPAAPADPMILVDKHTPLHFLSGTAATHTHASLPALEVASVCIHKVGDGSPLGVVEV